MIASSARSCGIGCLARHRGRLRGVLEAVEEPRGNLEVVAQVLAVHVPLLDTEGQTQGVWEFVLESLLAPRLIAVQDPTLAMLLRHHRRHCLQNALPELRSPSCIFPVGPLLRGRQAWSTGPRALGLGHLVLALPQRRPLHPAVSAQHRRRPRRRRRRRCLLPLRRRGRRWWWRRRGALFFVLLLALAARRRRRLLLLGGRRRRRAAGGAYQVRGE
mmetsp:Transcript_27644/g.73426  ORF Transcript_27644/g.73426 Transcript_27644/m.73426 type:complete len:216 (+) Transcript_27644:1681-2328(+)